MSKFFASSLLWCAVLFGTSVSASEVAQCQPEVTSPLQLVGQSQLKVFFFRVYDAVLHTNTGRYPDADTVALNLHYLRDIPAEKLLENTAEQWQKLGYKNSSEQQQWLERLKQLWPDVKQGDCLLAYTADGTSTDFYNRTGLLGSLDSADFTHQFFAIWLSEQSSYKRNRDQLTGVEP